MPIRIGVIGGSGFYQMTDLEVIEEREVDTPFGQPSDKFVIGQLGDERIAFLPRHARGHRLPPDKINMRANIYAFKDLGVEWLISINAVGSLRENIRPKDMVVPDQLVDFTRHRINTFFGEGLAAHASMADPFCPALRSVLIDAAETVGVRVHPGGTYICMEGPQFSSRAESEMYRQLGFDVIGMTVAPEAKLAREAELCYASLSCSTDYDCWHEEEEDVTVDMILEILRANVSAAQAIVCETVPKLPTKPHCTCSEALKYAIVTQPDAIPEEVRQHLGLLIQKYISAH